MRYAIVIEKAEGNYSAYVPDLPGCIATGATVPEIEAEIREAIEFHLEGMREDGLPIPAASSQVEYGTPLCLSKAAGGSPAARLCGAEQRRGRGRAPWRAS